MHVGMLAHCLLDDAKCVETKMDFFMKFLIYLFLVLLVFRWFKFTLKPPNSVTHGNLLWAIWDTSHWNFFVKFGLKTA